jgi:hypothetical protein
MLFPAIGLTTAIWLLFAPWLGVETGVRAGMGITVGAMTMVLLPLGIWNSRATAAVAGLGIFLGFANFFLVASVGGYASLAASSVFLVMAGTAPWPVVVARTGAAAQTPAADRPAPVVADDARRVAA